MAKVPAHIHSRLKAMGECISLDVAEFNAALEKAAVSFARFGATLECIALDDLEDRSQFPADDVQP